MRSAAWRITFSISLASCVLPPALDTMKDLTNADQPLSNILTTTVSELDEGVA